MRAKPECREQLMQQLILGESEKTAAYNLGWTLSKTAYHKDIIFKKYKARTLAQAVYLWMMEKQEYMA